MKNLLINLCANRSHIRCNVPNAGNGKSYMEAIIIDKSKRCILWDWYK